MNAVRKRLMIFPAFTMAVVAVVLAGGAILGSSDVPAKARSVSTTTKRSDLVAPAPEGLSSVTVTRDWQEVGTSTTKR